MQLNQLTSLFNSISQPVFFVQADQLSYCNPAAIRCGLQLHTRLEDLLPPGESLCAPEAARSMSMQLRLGDSSYDAAVYPQEDGYLFILSASVEKDASQALSSAASALRGPLTSLFSVSSSLFSVLGEPEDPSVRQNLSALIRSQYQILNLIHNLEDYASVCAGTLQLNRVRTELVCFLQELFDSVEPLCAASGRILLCRLPSKPVFCWIDPTFCRRMLLGLVGNAMKFSPPNAEITLSCTRLADSAVFYVTDSGEGMTPEVLSAAFSRFADRGLIPDPRWGAGFGLPLAKAIAELHGGAMVLQTLPDQGTTVAVRIPLQKPADALLSNSAYSPYDDGLSPELVALADVLPVDLFDAAGLL